MIRPIIMRLVQIWDFIKTDGFASFLRNSIYINRKAILIEKNLLEVNDSKRFLRQSNIKFEEITADTFNNKNYQFSVKNRYLKALHYLKKGYSGYAIVKGNDVIGDIWYSATRKSDQVSVHPDIPGNFSFPINSKIMLLIGPFTAVNLSASGITIMPMACDTSTQQIRFASR